MCRINMYGVLKAIFEIFRVAAMAKLWMSVKWCVCDKVIHEASLNASQGVRQSEPYLRDT